MSVLCGCGCRQPIAYPIVAPGVTVLFADNGQDVYCLDREHFMRWAEQAVGAWACGVVSAEATGWPDAYQREGAA